jgi:hypothetical protein
MLRRRLRRHLYLKALPMNILLSCSRCCRSRQMGYGVRHNRFLHQNRRCCCRCLDWTFLPCSLSTIFQSLTTCLRCYRRLNMSKEGWCIHLSLELGQRSIPTSGRKLSRDNWANLDSRKKRLDPHNRYCWRTNCQEPSCMERSRYRLRMIVGDSPT